LGYLRAALIFGCILTAIVATQYFMNFSKTFLFWQAFIVTRPLGVVVGDFLDKPLSSRGLALSRYSRSSTLLIIIIACILVFPQAAVKASH